MYIKITLTVHCKEADLDTDVDLGDTLVQTFKQHASLTKRLRRQQPAAGATLCEQRPGAGQQRGSDVGTQRVRRGEPLTLHLSFGTSCVCFSRRPTREHTRLRLRRLDPSPYPILFLRNWIEVSTCPPASERERSRHRFARVDLRQIRDERSVPLDRVSREPTKSPAKLTRSTMALGRMASRSLTRARA